MKNLRDYIPEGTPNGTPGLQSALAALGIGEKLFCPRGQYWFWPPDDGTDYVAKRVGSFYMEGEGMGTMFFLSGGNSGSFPDNVDFLRIECSSPVQETGWGISNFFLRTDGHGRHAINIVCPPDPSGLSGCYISGLTLLQTTDSTLRAASLCYSVIEKCNIHSIDIVTSGDGVRIQNCVLSSVRYWGVDGAAGFVLRDNVIAGTGLLLDCQKAVNPSIVNNEFETPGGLPNTAGACLSFGTTNTLVMSPQIIGNSISVLPGTNNPVPIALNNTYFAYIDGGFMHVIEGYHILMGSKAVNTRIGRGTWYRRGGVDSDAPMIANKQASTKFLKLIYNPNDWF